MIAVLRDRLALRALVLIAMLVLSIGAVACGDSDDDGGGGSAAADQSDGGGGAEEVSDEGGDSSTPEGQIRIVIDRFDKELHARDFEGICKDVTASVVKQALGFENHPTCEKAIEDQLTDDPTGKNVLIEPGIPDIQSITVLGNDALVRANRKGDNPEIAIFRKEQGAWKVQNWFSDRVRTPKKF